MGSEWVVGGQVALVKGYISHCGESSFRSSGPSAAEAGGTGTAWAVNRQCGGAVAAAFLRPRQRAPFAAGCGYASAADGRNGRIVGTVQAASSTSQLLVCNTQKRNEKKRENEATFMLTNWVRSVNIYALVLCWCSTVVVQLICNQQVGGSNPSTSSKSSYGGIPEWPKGADCKSVVNDFGGSNPPSPTRNK